MTDAVGMSALQENPVKDCSLRVAVVHDYLYTIGGAERVLQAILECFPEAHLFTLFNVLGEEDCRKLSYVRCTTSFLQQMPFIARRHRTYLPLMPIAIEQFDLSQYDLVLSSSYAVAKGVITGPDQLHVAYVHSPMRYAWDLQHKYLADAGLKRGARSLLARVLLHYLRVWDSRTTNGVDTYIANSRFVAGRIRKIYGRSAQVIHPPVYVPPSLPVSARGDYFLAASRLVSYKNVHLIAEAFRNLPQQRLVIVGDGPDRERIAALRIPNVEMVGFKLDSELWPLMAAAKAFIFAAEEDFGIVVVEAMGQGTPVIALGRGGARETVTTTGPRPTGMFFDRPEPSEITASVTQFLANESRYSRKACHHQALRFSHKSFVQKLTSLVLEETERFAAKTAGPVGDVSLAQSEAAE